MGLDLQNYELFSAAVDGLPKVAEVTATVPEAKLSRALAAAQQSYWQTAQNAWLWENRSAGMGIRGHVFVGYRARSERTGLAFAGCSAWILFGGWSSGQY